MRKQYLAEVQDGFCKPNEWWNAKRRYDACAGRYYNTLEEAQAGIKECVEKSNHIATQRGVVGTPPFSMVSEPNQKFIVTATRIRVREVTEWEEV